MSQSQAELGTSSVMQPGYSLRAHNQIKPSSQLGHFNVRLICVCMLEHINAVKKVVKGDEANEMFVQ